MPKKPQEDSKPKKEDLRIRKTKKALYSALLALLNRQKFLKITVNDICQEALVSRTAFYDHFQDKYDLLEQWLSEQQTHFLRIFRDCPARQAEDILYELFQTHSTVITNLLEEADGEQQALLYRFLSLDVDNSNTVRADFLAGGMFHVVFCQMKSYQKTTGEEKRKAIGCVYEMVSSILNQTADARNDMTKKGL